MVKIAFCDDDIAVVRQIAALLNKYRETRDQPMECHAFESSLELLAAMEQGLRPDVLLLDVIMPGENGISAAREIREYDRNVKIIFLTSSAEYAVQSYTVDAYYYQLKPIREETFFQVLDSVLDECRRSAENSVMLRCQKRHRPRPAGKADVLRGGGSDAAAASGQRPGAGERRRSGQAGGGADGL